MTEYAGVEEAVREIVSRVVLQVEEEHAKHLTEELRIQARQLDDYAARIAELEAELSACQKGNDSYHNQIILDHNRGVDMKLRIAELEALLSQSNEGYAECIATREDYRARIAELEALVKKAYREGWLDNHSAIGGGEEECERDWNTSAAHAALEKKNV